MKKILLLAGLTLLFVSCTKNFDEINKAKFGVTKEDKSRSPIGAAAVKNLIEVAAAEQENTWQYYDFIGAFSGYYSQTSFINDHQAYTPRNSYNAYLYDDTYGKKLYGGEKPGFFEIFEETQANYSYPVYALSVILRCATTQRLSDIYGALAFSKMKKGEFKTPYDSQREIYLKILEDLKKASEALDLIPSSYSKYASFDNVYSGNMKMWAKYARSIMLRMAVHIAKQEPTKAKEYAEYAVNKGVIMTNDENAQLKTTKNPINIMSGAYKDSRASADIVEYMKCFEDPRLNKIFTTVAVRNNEVFGLRSSSTVIIKDNANLHSYSLTQTKPETPLMMFNAAETSFLLAEGKMNGWNVSSKSVKELYEEGVKLSFDQWGIAATALESYLANENTRGAFVDEILPQLSAPDFKSVISVKWDNANGDKEKELSKIITQKWLAMYPHNIVEAWTEWRRTGYPNLMPSINNRSAGAVPNIVQVNGKDVGGMRRLKFSYNSWKLSPENMKNAVEMLGGPDEFATDLWWAK